jgi:hypothetical protein
MAPMLSGPQVIERTDIRVIPPYLMLCSASEMEHFGFPARICPISVMQTAEPAPQ